MTQWEQDLINRAGRIFMAALYDDERGGIRGEVLREMKAFVDQPAVKDIMRARSDVPFDVSPLEEAKDPGQSLLYGIDNEISPGWGVATQRAMRAADEEAVKRGLRAFVIIYDKRGTVDCAAPSNVLTATLMGMLQKVIHRLSML